MATYRAVQADPVTERDALLRLWSTNLPVRGSVAAKHQWLYVDGPAGRADAFVVRSSDSEVIGCAGLARRELWHAGRPVRAALFADFAIDRAHRSGLAAMTLQRAVKHHVDLAFDLGYGMPNAKAIAVYRRAGFVELGQMERYVRVLRHGGYLERRVATLGLPACLCGPAALAARAAGAVVDAPRRALDHLRVSWLYGHVSLVWLGDFDARFDQLWRATRDRFGIACRRDAEFLRWRFLRKPCEHDAIAALLDRDDGELRAYAVVDGAPEQTANILDAFGSLEALDGLLRLLAPALHARGHSAISMRFLGDPRIPALLRSHGFSLREAKRSVIATASTRGAIEPALVSDRKAWYLTDLDEDT